MSINLTCWLQPWSQCSWWTWQQRRWQKTSWSWCCSPKRNQLQQEKWATTERSWKEGLNVVDTINLLSPTLTMQVVPQRRDTEACVAGIVVDGLVAGSLVGDDKIPRFDRHWADKDGQQGYSDHQQDGEGGAWVDVGAHQAHEQTQQEDNWGVQHCVPVTMRKHPHPHGHRQICNRGKLTVLRMCTKFNSVSLRNASEKQKEWARTYQDPNQIHQVSLPQDQEHTLHMRTLLQGRTSNQCFLQTLGPGSDLSCLVTLG